MKKEIGTKPGMLVDGNKNGMVFRRGMVVTALSVGTVNVSKGDQCSCTGQPGQCD
jgi:hypothetical protein